MGEDKCRSPAGCLEPLSDCRSAYVISDAVDDMIVIKD